jgi:hypothetical protein
MFLRQSAQWSRRVPDSEDVFGTPQFENPVTIPVRAVEHHQTFFDNMGAVTTSDYIVWTTNDVQIGDKLVINGDNLSTIGHEMSEMVWFNGQRVAKVLRCVKMAA